MWFRINSMKKKGVPLWLKATVAPLHVVLFSQLLYIYNRAHRNWLLDGATCAVGIYSWPLVGPGHRVLPPVFGCPENEQLFVFNSFLFYLSKSAVKKKGPPNHRSDTPEILLRSSVSIVISIIIHSSSFESNLRHETAFSPSFFYTQQHTAVIYDLTRETIVRWVEYKKSS